MRDDEKKGVSVNEFTLAFKHFLRFLFRKKWWILLGAILLGAGWGVQAYLTEEEFQAELTFMVDNSDSNSGGGIAGILNQFGFAPGSSSGPNLDKIVALTKTKFIGTKVLLDTIYSEGEGSSLYDYLLLEKYVDLPEDQVARAVLEFPVNFEQLSPAQQLAFAMNFSYLTGNSEKRGAYENSYDEFTGIITFRARTENPELSVALVNSLYKQIQSYYSAKEVEQKQLTYNLLKSKSDSVYSAISETEQQLARVSDRGLGVLLNRDKILQSSLLRELRMLEILYGETIKNLETSSFLVASSTPIFQLIDAPFLPPGPIKPSVIKQGVLGGILGGGVVLLILTSLFIFKGVK